MKSQGKPWKTLEKRHEKRKTLRKTAPSTPRFPMPQAALVLEKCVMIQCHARGMLARRRTRQLRTAREDKEELERREATYETPCETAI